jgi:hypothetical protein
MRGFITLPKHFPPRRTGSAKPRGHQSFFAPAFGVRTACPPRAEVLASLFGAAIMFSKDHDRCCAIVCRRPFGRAVGRR